MKAIVVTTPGKASLVSDRPKPTLRDDYLLVKTRAVALNPTDWKHAEITQTPGVLLGCDYAGVVEEIGPKVTKPFKIGDRVMGFVHGGNSAQPEDGAFAEYIVVKGDIQAHMPVNMSFEEAATLGVGITSVGQGLYQTLKLPLPRLEEPDGTTRGPILINGGSTSTGVLGLPCARLSGFIPIATCSPHNFDIAKEFGAEEVFDYGEGDVAEEIRESTGDKLKLCWDTVSTRWTAGLCAGALSSSGGRLATLHPLGSPSPVVECVHTMAYTVFGEAWAMGEKQYPAVPEDFEFGKTWWSVAEKLIEGGRIRPHRMRIGTGGLEGVLEGLQMLRDANISGHKLVYLVEETP